MQEHSLFQVFISRLNRLDIGYMVTGAVASIVYGEPRLTHDIDLVVELSDKNARKIVEGFPSDEFYCPPLEVIKLETSRPLRGHFNIIHHESGFKADIYILGVDELHRWAMSNKKAIEMEGERFWVAPPEYVIIRKLQYYREGGSDKHLKDIVGMIQISCERIDLEVLTEKVKRYGLEEQWQEAQAMVEE